MSPILRLLSAAFALSLVSGAGGCANGGALDPFENLSPGSTNQTPPTYTDLLDCTVSTPTVPCKIALNDLSFAEASNCMDYKTDSMLGGTFANPDSMKDRLQFSGGADKTLQTCQPASVEIKQCDMTLTNLPALYTNLVASKIRLRFRQGYRMQSSTTVNPGSVATGVAISLGTLRAGNLDAYTLTNQRAELHEAAVEVPVAAHSLGFSVRTQCWNAAALPAYWYLDQVVAEVTP